MSLPTITGASASDNNAFALGKNAAATGNNAFAIGKNAEASEKDSQAFASGSSASDENAAALGNGITGDENDWVTVGVAANDGKTLLEITPREQNYYIGDGSVALWNRGGENLDPEFLYEGSGLEPLLQLETQGEGEEECGGYLCAAKEISTANIFVLIPFSVNTRLHLSFKMIQEHSGGFIEAVFLENRFPTGGWRMKMVLPGPKTDCGTLPEHVRRRAVKLYPGAKRDCL